MPSGTSRCSARASDLRRARQADALNEFRRSAGHETEAADRARAIRLESTQLADTQRHVDAFLHQVDARSFILICTVTSGLLNEARQGRHDQQAASDPRHFNAQPAARTPRASYFAFGLVQLAQGLAAAVVEAGAEIGPLRSERVVRSAGVAPSRSSASRPC